MSNYYPKNYSCIIEKMFPLFASKPDILHHGVEIFDRFYEKPESEMKRSEWERYMLVCLNLAQKLKNRGNGLTDKTVLQDELYILDALKWRVHNTQTVYNHIEMWKDNDTFKVTFRDQKHYTKILLMANKSLLFHGEYDNHKIAMGTLCHHMIGIDMIDVSYLRPAGSRKRKCM